METGYREKLVDTSKNFKTNWLNLGELLSKVASEKLYVEWGFRHFEDYCKEELKIKKSTAIKLTNAYFFIRQEDPDLKDKDLDLDVIKVLQKAKRDDDVSDEAYSELKDLATDKKRSSQTINKRYKDLTKEEEDTTQAQEFNKNTSMAARRLLQRIRHNISIPEKYKETLNEMVSFFDAEAKVS